MFKSILMLIVFLCNFNILWDGLANTECIKNLNSLHIILIVEVEIYDSRPPFSWCTIRKKPVVFKNHDEKRDNKSILQFENYLTLSEKVAKDTLKIISHLDVNHNHFFAVLTISTNLWSVGSFRVGLSVKDKWQVLKLQPLWIRNKCLHRLLLHKLVVKLSIMCSQCGLTELIIQILITLTPCSIL